MTATAMLAKVYLFGADELGNTSWYGIAEQKALEVINSGTYSLVDDPGATALEDLINLWSLGNQNSSEDIFAVQHYSSGGWNNGNVAQLFQMAINPRLDRNLNIWGFGWIHTYESIEAQWSDSDPRKRFSLFFNGDDVVTVNGDTLGQYNSATARAESRLDSGGPKKFWWSESYDRVAGTSDLDAKALRYAELLLIHAEADLMADGSLSTAGANSFNNGEDAGTSSAPLNWNTRNVTDMSEMFRNATSFNQSIGNQNVGNVTNMSTMFGSATSFNQPIGGWDVSNVTDISYMFWRAASFRQLVSDWDVSNVTRRF